MMMMHHQSPGSNVDWYPASGAGSLYRSGRLKAKKGNASLTEVLPAKALLKTGQSSNGGEGDEGKEVKANESNRNARKEERDTLTGSKLASPAKASPSTQKTTLKTSTPASNDIEMTSSDSLFPNQTTTKVRVKE